MESRAFGATRDRTNLFELVMEGRDYAVVVISLVLLVALIYMKLYLPPFEPLFPYRVLI
jgi:energy-coupling factor transporter transmembrane protein EcfT